MNAIWKDWYERLKAHALANYDKDGWDFFVECWGEREFEEFVSLEQPRTYVRVKRLVHDIVVLQNERRQDVRAHAADFNYDA